jgi:hypothetical protein
VLALVGFAPAAGADEVEIKDGKGTKIQIKEGTIRATDDNNAVQLGGQAGEAEKAISFTGNKKKLSHTCVPGKAVIQLLGNHNQLTLKGDCQRVLVTGNSLTVDLERAAEITVTGNKIQVTYLGGVGAPEPKVTVTGNKSSVRKRIE